MFWSLVAAKGLHWEVGAGGPSVPRWLRQRVGDTGRVLASDIDTSLLEGDSDRRYEVARHDVGVDEPPATDFDLVHARLVLVHVTRRHEALETMARALRPGGWLLIEEADPQLQPLACPDEYSDDQRLANKIKHAFRELMRERGVDLRFDDLEARVDLRVPARERAGVPGLVRRLAGRQARLCGAHPHGPRLGSVRPHGPEAVVAGCTELAPSMARRRAMRSSVPPRWPS